MSRAKQALKVRSGQVHRLQGHAPELLVRIGGAVLHPQLLPDGVCLRLDVAVKDFLLLVRRYGRLFLLVPVLAQVINPSGAA